MLKLSFARQAGHDAPLHQAEATGLDHGMEFARNQMAGTRQQVGQVVVDKAWRGGHGKGLCKGAVELNCPPW